MAQKLALKEKISSKKTKKPSSFSILHIRRRFTRPGVNPLDEVTYLKRSSVINNPDGSVVFQMKEVEAPESWSQLATDIAASKYFRKAGVPGTERETSVRQLVHRIAHTLRIAGEMLGGYFKTKEEADTFEAELAHLLIHQKGAFNSPVWFNCGLFHEYKISGSGGNWSWNPKTGEVEETKDSYSRPQCSACFIQSVQDDLMSIFNLAKSEAKLFKFGSGCTSGNSLVFIDGEGLLSIRSLFKRFQDKGKMLTPFDAKGSYYDIADEGVYTFAMDAEGSFHLAKIEKVWCYEVSAEDKMTVSLANGTRVTVSRWHPFMVWDGERIVERRADALRRGDAVLTTNPTILSQLPSHPVWLHWTSSYFRKVETYKTLLDPELSWLIGYFLGDGNLGSHRSRIKGHSYTYLRLRFHDESTETLERVQRVLKSRFDAASTLRRDSRGSRGYTLQCLNRKAAGFFLSILGKPGAKGKNLSVPAAIWQGGPPVMAAFLAGLLDSDGYITRDGKAVYSSASCSFASYVAAMASLLGCGGGTIEDRDVRSATIIRKGARPEQASLIAEHLTNRKRLARLGEAMDRGHRSPWCLPLQEGALEGIIPKQHSPQDWLKVTVGARDFHLGRLHYEGMVNPHKLLAVLEASEASSEKVALLERVASGVTFVTKVEPAKKDVDFYDLTISGYETYLAGEEALVVIHNTGTNFSRLRGRQEKLSGGGTSSGLMSFLEVLDKGAGATKSGGTTRRAAKMVCLDMDHPEIVDFIHWKVREEKKVKVLIDAGYPSDFNGEAYKTVSGQNSNNSIRVTDAFMQAVLDGKKWETRFRTTGEVCDTYEARDVMKQIAEAAWSCADPGVQYDTTINKWHKVPNTDRIYASNPCVTGDTLVATREGYRRIKDLVGKSVDVIAADGKPRRASRVLKTGTKPVYELRTHGGYTLKLTADHKVYTLNRGDVPAAELSPGDLLTLGIPGFGTERLDSMIAEALGASLGDGCISSQGEQEHLFITLGKEEEAVAENLRGAIETTKAAFAEDGRGRRPVALLETPTTLRVGTSSRGFVSIMKRFAVLDEGSENKRLRDTAFGLDRTAQAAILRGLFTTDGTIADYGDKSQYISLDSTSLELLQQAQLLLLGFGIKSKIYRNRRPASQNTNELPDGRGGLRAYPLRQFHSLRISRASRVLFEREIGFLPGSAKVRRLSDMNARVGTYQEELTDTFEGFTPIGVEDVYDLTEPITAHFVVNGLVVHNCSEFMFLDDTACNLASINLMKFLNEEGSFDIEGYRHACRIFILAQEIIVDFASYPTKKIAQNSHEYRPLGLGYANLGTLLMVNGISYDSDRARAIAGALTAIMCGQAYRVSAEIASQKGPFPGFEKNREPMLRVMGMHRDEAYKINATACPQDLLAAAREDWDEAIRLGKRYGYRNAQATVIAPTGTIGLLMDCDTTGVEPDFALVKFKKLAGGGYFKIVNQSVSMALQRLHYTEKEIRDILTYVNGTLTLEGAPYINPQTLKAKGLTDEDLNKIEAALPSLFELPYAFTVWTLGEETMKRLGITPEAYKRFDFNLLKALGFTLEQIEAANQVICGQMTVEGAPHLREEHLPVFDCANKCGKYGKRFIAPMGHVRMMAAVQKFICGAISKTVNLPNDATVQDIEQIYMEGWKLGLKAIALYRDGCKMSQPLNTTGDTLKEDPAKKEADAPTSQQPLFPHRRRLSKKRRGSTQEAKVGGHKIYVRTGEYEDGKLGEIFVDMHKEGATLRSIMNCFAIAVSLGLQYGVPLEEYVNIFTHQKFEPHGPVDHPNIKHATSIVDFIFRLLAFEYLGRTDLVHVQKDPALPATPPTITTEEHHNSSNGNGRLTSENRIEDRVELNFDLVPVGMDDQMSQLMGDAPFCSECGHLTVRSGACYKCLNCGNSMGCS